jgi:hypothetical protein
MMKRMLPAVLFLVLVSGCNNGAGIGAKPSLPVVAKVESYGNEGREETLPNGQRRVMFGDETLTMHFVLYNQSSNQITVNYLLEKPAGGKNQSGSVNIPPNGKADCYWDDPTILGDGSRIRSLKKVESGDKITISHPNHSPVVLVVK